MRLTTRDSQILGNIYGAPTCGNIFRRDYLLAVGGFDQALFPSADYFFLHAFNDAFRIYRTKTYFGYYRWLDNESLKPSTLEAFITQTEALREVLAKETLLGRVLDKLFRNERHFQLQRGVKTLDKDSRVDFDALSRSLGYTFHPFKYRVFIVLRYGYWYARRVLTILFS